MPGETHTITKIAIFVGIAFVLIAAFNPAAGAAWTNFTNSIQNFPQFNNPFSSPASFNAFTIIPNRNGQSVGQIPTAIGATIIPESITNPSGSTNCTGAPPTDWFGCVRDKSNFDIGTYLTIGFSQPQPNFVVGLQRIPGFGQDVPVGSITIHYTCQTRGTQYATDVYVFDYTGKTITTNGVAMPTCPVNRFAYQSFTINFPSSPPPRISDLNGGFIGFHGEIGAAGNFQDYDFVSMDLAPIQSTSCTNGDVACAINQGFQTALNVAAFIVNVFIFLGQIIFYFVNAALQFFALFGYFFSIAGMPPILQGLITVLFIGFALYVAVSFFGKIRGTGNVG